MPLIGVNARVEFPRLLVLNDIAEELSHERHHAFLNFHRSLLRESAGVSHRLAVDE